MKFVCYTDETDNIVIELVGRKLQLTKWQFVRDTAKNVLSKLDWVKGVSLPGDRKILLSLKQEPTVDQWEAALGTWLNIIEVRGIKPKSIEDSDVSYAETDEDDSPRSAVPDAVVCEIQKAFENQIEVVKRHLRHVKEMKDSLEEQVNALEASRMHLRQLAEFLDAEDEDDENWVEIAKERGALQ